MGDDTLGRDQESPIDLQLRPFKLASQKLSQRTPTRAVLRAQEKAPLERGQGRDGGQLHERNRHRRPVSRRRVQ